MGFGTPGGSGLFDPALKLIPPVDPLYSYDLDKARELLNQAGWVVNDKGTLVNTQGEAFPTIELMTTDLPIRQQQTQMWQSSLSKLGITMNATYVTAAVNVAEMGKPIDEKPAHTSGLDMWPAYADLSGELFYLQSSQAEGGVNWAGWQNAEYDQLYAQAMASPNEEDRTALYWQMTQLVQQDAFVVVTAYVDTIQVSRNWVKNWQVNPGLQDVQIFYPVYIEDRPVEYDHLQ